MNVDTRPQLHGRPSWSRWLIEARDRMTEASLAETELASVVDPGSLHEFQTLVRRGAGTLDIPEATTETSYTRPIEADERIVRREVQRVSLHCESLNKLLERFVGRADRILDMGCGTGATSVAMALSPSLSAKEVIGLDPNRHSLEAARARAKAYGLDATRLRFSSVRPFAPLPFESASFDLSVCVSVLEYVPSLVGRHRLAAELERVTKPGGHVLLITPSPFRLRDYHTGRLLGDWRRDEGYPWSSPPWELSAMLRRCELISVGSHQLENAARRLGWRVAVPPALRGLAYALPWQKVLGKRLED